MCLNEVRGLVGYPGVGVVGEFDVEPAGAAFEEVKFCAGVEGVLEAGGIVLSVALSGYNLVGGDYSANCSGLSSCLDSDRGEKAKR